MALDLVSVPFSSESGPPPSKRRRLGWDVPDPLLLAEAARLQFQLACQLIQIYPSLASSQGNKLSGTSKVHVDSICIGTEKASKVETKEFQEEGGKRAASLSPPWREDDEDGHFSFEVGDSLTSRYKILQKMGEGTFGRVLECWDQDAQGVVAIKVVRSADRHREAAMIEIDVLQTLTDKDRSGSRGCVQMRRWFDYRNHICIVFEKLGPSLYDFLRANDYRPFSVDLVQDFGRSSLPHVKARP